MHSPSLINAILSCTTQEELEEFLIDLLTPAEREEFTQRLDIAHRLYTKQSYKNIEQSTNASSTTIARVAKFLHRPKS
jgi:TrpR-related protein YerC/YecD